MPFIHEQLLANGTTQKGRIVASKAIIDIIKNGQVLTMAVSTGGTGYVVGETFEFLAGSTVAGVTVSGFVATGIVTAISGGVVTALKILSSGAYSTLPTGATATTTNASAAGTGLVLTFTTQVTQWTQDRNDFTDEETDFEWIATSIKAADAPTVGLSTEVSGADGAVRLVTASGFNSGSTFLAQPGAPPDNEMYCSVSGTDPEIYVSVTDRRVNFVFRDGNNVQYGQIGLFLPFTDTAANYPFPGACFGQSRAPNIMSEAMNRNTNGDGNAGIVNCTSSVLAGQLGAYQYRDNLSPAWLGIAEDNADGAEDQRAQIWPQQSDNAQWSFTFAPLVDGFSTDPFSDQTQGILSDNRLGGWFQGSGAGGVPGVSPLGTGNRMTLTVEVHIISNQINDVQVIGIVDGYEACHSIGLTAFEEIERDALAKRYLVFPDTNTADLKRWVAMEKV